MIEPLSIYFCKGDGLSVLSFSSNQNIKMKCDSMNVFFLVSVIRNLIPLRYSATNSSFLHDRMKVSHQIWFKVVVLLRRLNRSWRHQPEEATHENIKSINPRPKSRSKSDAPSAEIHPYLDNTGFNFCSGDDVRACVDNDGASTCSGSSSAVCSSFCP